MLASSDEFTYIRSLENFNIPLYCLGHHQSSVKCVRFKPSEPQVVASASRDGDIALWDLRFCSANVSSNVPVNVLRAVHRKIGGKTDGPSSVAAFEFLPYQDHLIASVGQPDQYHIVSI